MLFPAQSAFKCGYRCAAAGPPGIPPGKTHAVAVSHCGRQHGFIEPLRSGTEIFWIHRQTLFQELARRLSLLGQIIQMRPGGLGIHMIRCYRRNAAPVIDSSGDQLWKNARAQIWGRLDIHLRAEDQTRYGERPNQLFQIRLRCLRHFCVWLGSEILNNDFLNVTILLMQSTDREQ